MPIVLIIGAGSNVGLATAELFSKAGYTIAVASRSNKTGSKFKHFHFDAAKPDMVPSLFNQVKDSLGTPRVVIYNGIHLSALKPPKNSHIEQRTVTT